MSTNWTNHQTSGHPSGGVGLSDKQKEALLEAAAWMDLRSLAVSEEPGTKGYMIHLYVFLERQIYRQRNQVGDGQGPAGGGQTTGGPEGMWGQQKCSTSCLWWLHDYIFVKTHSIVHFSRVYHVSINLTFNTCYEINTCVHLKIKYGVSECMYGNS